MYDELVKDLRENHDKYFARDMEAADAIEELANKLCDWCGVCPKKRRRPWDCEIMWPNAQVQEVYIELSKEEH